MGKIFFQKSFPAISTVNISEILAHADHTNLSPDAGWDSIKKTVDEGIRFGTASVCIPPCFVKRASEYAAGKVKICTVIGFPCGYNPTEVKVAETAAAVRDGADEIDMVINVGALKDGDTDFVSSEIKEIRDACAGKILKVIIECCLLTDSEMAEMCRIVADAGADYIKTSTGFSKGGADPHNVKILCDNAPEGLKVKAAGGISSLDDAEEFLSLGADRLGTSRLVKIALGMESTGY